MKMNKMLQRGMSLVLALAMVVTGATMTKKSANAKAKSYNCFLMYADKTWKCQNMKENVANVAVKNKKGSANYTVTLKKAQAKAASKEAAVFCVDIKNILKDHSVKNVKMSNVVIKLDGKKLKINSSKLKQGILEKKKDPKKYRLEIYNVYGEGKTAKNPCAKATAFKWSKSISVSFKLTIKK